MKLLDASGKALSIEGIDPKVAALITSAFDGISAQMATATTEAMVPIQESVQAMTDQVKTIADAAQENKTNAANQNTGNTDGKDQGGNQQTDPAIQEILDGMKKLTGRMDANDAETEASKTASTGLKLTKDYFEANHPTVQGKASLIARIAATNPADEAAVKAAVETERKHMSDVYGEEATAKAFSADIKDENGKTGEVGDKEAEEKQKIEKMEAELKTG
ncbi:hypothetical protein COB72_03430 [bacterium]|nr:MAG: hypothetical protein COB72_03430 [bacterium]